MKDKRNCYDGTVSKSSLEQYFHKFSAITFNYNLLCEISGVLHLVQPGLTAGWQTTYRLISKFSKLVVG